jgi:hypothetical protein
MIEQKLRLHISPFSPELASTILPKRFNVAPDSISYHTLDTFPEKNYGYVELPVMEAEKLKKKLNGSILKGKKLRIEDARPSKRRIETDQDGFDNSSPQEQETRPPKKSKKGSNSELQGHELSPERRVKRGWTEPKTKERRKGKDQSGSRAQASKYTNKPECLFRLEAAQLQEDNSARPSTKDNDRRKRRKGATVVHEFEKTVAQPSFIRIDTGSKKVGVAAEYVEGKGWVDSDGNVVDVDKRQLRDKSPAIQQRTKRNTLPTSSHGGSYPSTMRKPSLQPGPEHEHSPSEDGRMDQHNEATPVNTADSGADTSDEEISSSGVSSDVHESSSESGEQESESSATDQPLANGTLPDETSAAKGGVHPLEALFKRPGQAASQANSKRPLEIKTSFTFFEPDDEQAVAQTPFTTRDLQMRGQRSAAPTPDTALPTRRFFAESVSPSSKNADDEGVDFSHLPSDSAPSKDTEPREESEFAKWFWEHRGENNRAWKRRRREALKEKRQRENRQKGHRIG